MQRIVDKHIENPRSETEVRWLFYRIGAVFTGLWLLVVFFAQVALFLMAGESGVVEAGLPGPIELPAGAVIVALVCIPNAGLVSGWLWSRLARWLAPLTARRGTILGGIIGIVTYVTATVPFATIFALWDHGWRGFGLGALIRGDFGVVLSAFLNDLIEALLRFPGFVFVGSVVMVIITLGIPLFLSTAVGRALGISAEHDRAT
jgi:hypothetical protein